MSETVKHSTMSGVNAHAIIRWDVASAQELPTELATADKGKVAFLQDTGQFLILQSTDPVEWVALSYTGDNPITGASLEEHTLTLTFEDETTQDLTLPEAPNAVTDVSLNEEDDLLFTFADGSSVTVELPEGYSGNAIESVSYDSETDELTFTHRDGTTTVISLGGGGGSVEHQSGDVKVFARGAPIQENWHAFDGTVVDPSSDSVIADLFIPYEVSANGMLAHEGTDAIGSGPPTGGMMVSGGDQEVLTAVRSGSDKPLVLNLATGDLREIEHTPSNRTFSHGTNHPTDPSTVLYSFDDEDGDARIFSLSFGDSIPEPVTDKLSTLVTDFDSTVGRRMIGPHPSDSDKVIFSLGKDITDFGTDVFIYTVDVNTGAVEQVISEMIELSSGSDYSFVYFEGHVYMSDGGSESSIRKIDVEEDTIENLMPIPDNMWEPNFTVAPGLIITVETPNDAELCFYNMEGELQYKSDPIPGVNSVYSETLFTDNNIVVFCYEHNDIHPEPFFSAFKVRSGLMIDYESLVEEEPAGGTMAWFTDNNGVPGHRTDFETDSANLLVHTYNYADTVNTGFSQIYSFYYNMPGVVEMPVISLPDPRLEYRTYSETLSAPPPAPSA